MFTKLISALKATRRTIVFTEGPDARILEAADRLIKDDLMDVILIGNVDEVKAAAAKGGFDIAKAEIIEWEHTVDGDGGLEDAPEIWPVEKFARALRDHYDDFNDFMRRNIAEYETLAAQLPEAFAHPLGQ